jgi:hypothetical protein
LRHEPKFPQSAQEFYQDSSRLPPVVSDFAMRFSIFTSTSRRTTSFYQANILFDPVFSFGITVVYLDTAKGGNCRYPHILKIIARYISERKGV